MDYYLTPTKLSVLTITVGLLYYCYRRMLCKPIPGIPYNKNAGYTLLGDVPEMIRASKSESGVFPWMATLPAKHKSPICQIFVRPFSKPWIIVADFRETQDILLRRTKEFDRSPSTTEVFTGIAPDFHMNLQSDTENFKYHKLLLRDLMTPAFLHNVAAPHVHNSVMNLVELWKHKARLAQGHPVDAFDDVFSVLLDSIAVVSFGLNLDDGILSSRLKYLADAPKYTVPKDNNKPVEITMPPKPVTFEALITLTNALNGVIQSPVPRVHHFFVAQMPFYKKAFRIKEDMINTELEKGLKRLQSGDFSEKCALDNILQREWQAAKKANRPPNHKSRAISDELFGFLIAGEDTTASTMTWGWKFISANQSVQAKLRSHLFAAFPEAVKEERSPTVEEIIKSHIPYLEATIEEIHRSASILPMFIRRAFVDVQVLGHTIPAGYDVAFAVTGPSFAQPAFDIADSQRSASSLAAKQTYGTWDQGDVSEFKPERWIKKEKKSEKDEEEVEVFDPMAGPILTFSTGPRGCYGRRLAYLQMRIMLVLVLWNLELMEVTGELASMKRIEKISTVPRYCCLRLKEVRSRG